MHGVPRSSAEAHVLLPRRGPPRPGLSLHRDLTFTCFNAESSNVCAPRRCRRRERGVRVRGTRSRGRGPRLHRDLYLLQRRSQAQVTPTGRAQRLSHPRGTPPRRGCRTLPHCLPHIRPASTGRALRHQSASPARLFESKLKTGRARTSTKRAVEFGSPV